MPKVKKHYGLDLEAAPWETTQQEVTLSASHTVCAGRICKVITDLLTLTTCVNPYSMNIIRCSSFFGTALFHFSLLLYNMIVWRAKTEALLKLN